MRPFRNGNDNSRSRSYLTNDAPLLQNELQNLDMELQILKRQREIIFKQRQVENRLFSQRLNSFDQPSTSFSLEPKQNYDTNYSGRRNHSNSKAHKRPSERSFDNPGPKQLRSNSWGDRHSSQARKPQPLMKIPLQQHKKAPKPFPNNKPSEGFVEPRGNNLRLQRDFPLSQAKAKVKKIDEKSIPIFKNTFDPKKKSYSSDDFLRPNIVPSPSVNGRLELALGELLKRIKTSPQLNEDQKRQLTALDMRCIKAILRQRISSVMMNKQVRSMAETVAEYKKTYRKDIDNEIMVAIEKTHMSIDTKSDKLKIKNISATETAKIHKFFKSKINMVLKNKVQNMIDNLLKIYGDNEEQILDCIKDLPELGGEKKETEKQNKNGETNIEMVESLCNEINNYNTKEHIEESDKKIVENNSGDIEVTENKANSDNTQEIITESSVKSTKNNADETINLTNSENDEAKKATMEADRQQAEINERRAKLKEYYKLMDLLIENRLPKLLLKFKDEFARMMYCEKDFIVGKEMIMMELKETLRKSLYAANNIDKVKDVVNNDIEATVKAEESTLNQEPEVVLNKDTDNNKDAQKKIDVEVKDKSHQQVNTQDVVKPTHNVVQKGSQLFVMLLGRPSLPTKVEIYDFLNKFNPKSIKKHKTVNNLLVVGFENKDDYDKILKANETKVGNATFIIKANEVIASDKQKEKTTSGNNVEEINKSTEEKVDQKNIDENVSQTTEEIIKVTEEQVVEKNTNETKIDDVRESDEKIIQDKTENNEEQVKENKEETIEKMEAETIKAVSKINDNTTESDDVNKAEAIDVNDEVTDITDKSNGEKVFLDKNINNKSNRAKESTANYTEGNVKTGDVINTNDGTENKDTEKVSNLEVIQGSEEDVVNKVDDNKKVNVTTEDAKVTNDVTENKDTDIVGKLETIPESEEGTVKPKTRAAAVATPTRSSSRIANTPSSIRTRRASRLAQ